MPRACSVLNICLALIGSLGVATLFLAFERPAYAYVDPGTGFVLLQVAGSMVAGALFYLRHRVRKLFGFIDKPESQPASPAIQAEHRD